MATKNRHIIIIIKNIIIAGCKKQENGIEPANKKRVI